MSWRTAAPGGAGAPCSAASPSRWIIRSTCLVGVNCLRSMTSPNASMLGASIAASRAASRACASSSPRSSPRIQPIAHVTSSRELPVMCGTLKRSRTTVTPARGIASGIPGPSSPSPKLLGLELAHQVRVGDLVEQRRERVVHQRLRVGARRAAGRTRTGRRG